MVLNTVTAAAGVMPEVVRTSISHYVDRKPRRHKPTAHMGYDLGLHVVRRFLNFSSTHAVEDIQAFTSQWIPAPAWVKTIDLTIPQANITSAASHLIAQLESYGPDGIEVVGGKKWWQWRPEDVPLRAEWIEMRRDYNERKEKNEKGSRVILYIHGGAYYFGSVDEHRYQMQQHARKLKARCLAPRYRLAPQFPFPCGLLDCLAAYLYLLDHYDPSHIVVSGDSAGGGMTLSLLVLLRDRGLPLPAGGNLLSPWVDLMHSFPSLAGDGKLDYIPHNGFIHKPSIYWPPPTMEEQSEGMPTGVAAARINEVAESAKGKEEKKDEERGFSAQHDPNAEEHAEKSSHRAYNPVPSIDVNGTLIKIRDQIQLYAPNNLLTHPLVSPVLQPSLGGLCPLLIQVGGGEMLHDEQVYIAHKAANPHKYPAPPFILEHLAGTPALEAAVKYPPTHVQLQVFDDLCHVGHTLSWTKPAKYLYRSVAQFSAWALARAQKRSIDIEDEAESESISESSDSEECSNPAAAGASSSGEVSGAASKDRLIRRGERSPRRKADASSSGAAPRSAPMAVKSVGRAGDPLPAFSERMIRQRVDRHGAIFALAPAAELGALRVRPDAIGVLKEVPVRKWLARQDEWNRRYAKTKRRIQERRDRQDRDCQRERRLQALGIPPDEKPPPTAIVAMTARERDIVSMSRAKRSWGMMLWSKMGSMADKVTVEKAAAALALNKKEEGKSPVAEDDQAQQEKGRSVSNRSRSRSNVRARGYSRAVSDEGQADDGLKAEQKFGDTLSPSDAGVQMTQMNNEIFIPLTKTTSARPIHGDVAYPFKLSVPKDDRKSINPSMITLTSDHSDGSEKVGDQGEASEKVDDYNEGNEKVDEHTKSDEKEKVVDEGDNLKGIEDSSKALASEKPSTMNGKTGKPNTMNGDAEKLSEMNAEALSPTKVEVDGVNGETTK